VVTRGSPLSVAGTSAAWTGRPRSDDVAPDRDDRAEQGGELTVAEQKQTALPGFEDVGPPEVGGQRLAGAAACTEPKALLSPRTSTRTGSVAGGLVLDDGVADLALEK
jgi:hypothetical protein